MRVGDGCDSVGEMQWGLRMPEGLRVAVGSRLSWSPGDRMDAAAGSGGDLIVEDDALAENPEKLRHHLRRAAVLAELSYAYGLGEHPEARRGTRRRPPWVEADPALITGLTKRGLTVDEQDQLDRWNPPRWLIDAAAPGYQRFRKELGATAGAHREMLDGLVRTDWNAEAARGPAPVERAGGGRSGSSEIEDFLDDVLAVMRKRRLAPASGSAPLLGAFATAVALGVHPRWSPLGWMHSLPVVPRLAGGTLIQGLAYAQLFGRTGGDPGPADVAALGLTMPGRGKGLMAEQYQLVDGQIWALRRIGGVRVKDIEAWSGKLRQQIQATVRETDRAIGMR